MVALALLEVGPRLGQVPERCSVFLLQTCEFLLGDLQFVARVQQLLSEGSGLLFVRGVLLLRLSRVRRPHLRDCRLQGLRVFLLQAVCFGIIAPGP